MAHKFDFDLFVIGAGSGGVRAARITAQSGARVGIAEEYRYGGTCVIRGCIPKKYLVYASDYGKKLKEASGYGWTFEGVSYDHNRFMTSVANEVERLSQIYRRNLENAGVRLFDGRATFVDQNTLKIDGNDSYISAEKILVATGGTPWRPSEIELPGVSKSITSNEVFDLRTLPSSVAISGGGYIAVEFAHIFAGLGVSTTLIYRGEKVLKQFDEDIRTEVHENLSRSGIRVVTQSNITEITDSNCATYPYRVSLSNGQRIDTGLVVMATGRIPNTSGLGCERAGIELGSNGEIKVDYTSKTNVANIWAVGDVTDRVQLTPVAIREGHAFADSEFGNRVWNFGHDNIATAVFSQPEVGTVGCTEAEAKRIYGEVKVFKTKFRSMKQILSSDETRVMMKIIVRSSDDLVVGVHMVGSDSAEIIQAIGIAVKNGVTKADFDRTCAVHPTVAEELVTMR